MLWQHCLIASFSNGGEEAPQELGQGFADVLRGCGAGGSALIPPQVPVSPLDYGGIPSQADRRRNYIRFLGFFSILKTL